MCVGVIDCVSALAASTDWTVLDGLIDRASPACAGVELSRTMTSSGCAPATGAATTAPTSSHRGAATTKADRRMGALPPAGYGVPILMEDYVLRLPSGSRF